MGLKINGLVGSGKVPKRAIEGGRGSCVLEQAMDSHGVSKAFSRDFGNASLSLDSRFHAEHSETESWDNDDEAEKCMEAVKGSPLRTWLVGILVSAEYEAVICLSILFYMCLMV